MEASIIFQFAGRGSGAQRLALIDFAQLLDPRWRAPHEQEDTKPVKTSLLQGFLHSAYNFVQGGTFTTLTTALLEVDGLLVGIAGAFGATIVYPIDMGE
jgi:solute carrier family 25 aspartate/glutamate transporter 12/13